MDLKELSQKIKAVLLGDVRKLIMDARGGNMVVVEEKKDGDSATEADIKIGNMLGELGKALIPDSLIIEEETFGAAAYETLRLNPAYVWVIDPIDGTKAFRTSGNNEYCVVVALLHHMRPVLSLLYAPEYEGGLLFEAIEGEDGITLNGEKWNSLPLADRHDIPCVSHVSTDTALNDMEKAVQSLFETKEMIRAYNGHSTAINYALVAKDKLQRVFTRRDVNLWDSVQGAYLVEKLGGKVFYADGTDVFPIDINLLTFGGNKLRLPFNIACHPDLKQDILERISRM